jgi:hypothetical protein
VKIKPAPVGAPAVILRWTIAGDTQSLLYVFCGRDAEQVVVAECAGGGA